MMTDEQIEKQKQIFNEAFNNIVFDDTSAKSLNNYIVDPNRVFNVTADTHSQSVTAEEIVENIKKTKELEERIADLERYVVDIFVKMDKK